MELTDRVARKVNATLGITSGSYAAAESPVQTAGAYVIPGAVGIFMSTLPFGDRLMRCSRALRPPS